MRELPLDARSVQELRILWRDSVKRWGCEIICLPSAQQTHFPSVRPSFRSSLIGLSKQQAQFRGPSEVPKLISLLLLLLLPLGWRGSLFPRPSQISSSPIRESRGHISSRPSLVAVEAVLAPLVENGRVRVVIRMTSQQTCISSERQNDVIILKIVSKIRLILESG